MQRILVFIILVFTTTCTNLYPQENIFDSCTWELDKEKREVILYIYNDGKSEINYYKSVIFENDINPTFLADTIWDFDSYSKMYVLTKLFKIKKNVDTHHRVVVAELIFFPYKNRTFCFYATRKDTLNKNGKLLITIEWYGLPLKEALNYYNPDKNAFFVDKINGRWVIEEIDGNTVSVSLEYHNDWETNLPMSFVWGIEKIQIRNNLKSMIMESKKRLKELSQ